MYTADGGRGVLLVLGWSVRKLQILAKVTSQVGH